MVTKIRADFVDQSTFSHDSSVGVTHRTTTRIVNDRLVTYKHVSVLLNYEDGDPYQIAIDLAPVRALALVKRLLRALDALSREGVEIPPMNSLFMDQFLETDSLDKLSPDYDDYVAAIRDSVLVRDGEALRDILPPSLR